MPTWKGLLAVGLLCGGVSLAHSQEVETLPTLPGAIISIPHDINNNDVAVGLTYAPDHSQVPTKWVGNQVIRLLGVEFGVAQAINDAGIIVGTGFSPNDHFPRPMLWRTQDPMELPTLGGGGQALGINESGDIVGYVLRFEARVPALWRDGTLTLLPLPSYLNEASARQIDDKGRISGTAICSLTQRSLSIVWDRGQVIELPTNPSAPLLEQSSDLIGGGNGVAVGNFTSFAPDFNVQIGCVWRGNVHRPLDPLSPMGDSSVFGANGQGVAYGSSIDRRGIFSPVMWDDNGATRLPMIADQYAGATGGNERGSIVGFQWLDNGQSVPLRWRMDQVTRPEMPNLWVLPGREVIIEATAAKGASTLPNMATEFRWNQQPLGVVPTNAQGVARVTFVLPPNVTLGVHEIMASLGGSKYILRKMVVGPAPTQSQVITAVGKAGEAVTLRATVSVPDLPVTVMRRTVQFWQGNTLLGTARTDSAGFANLVTRLPNNVSPGEMEIQVRFPGDRNLRPSTGYGRIIVQP